MILPNTRFAGLLALLLGLLGPAGHAQTWQWTNRAEGTNTNYSVNEAATDAAGNLYVAGRYVGTAQFGATTLVAPNWSMFVAKLSPAGQWLWAVRTGAGIFEEAHGLAVDAAGTHVYVAGTLSSGTHTLGPSTVTIPSLVCTHGAVFGALSAADGQWEWAQAADNGSGIKGLGLAADGSLTVSGYCKGTNFTLGGATVPGTLPEGSVFVARYSATGQPQWITAAPVSGMASGLALDAAGNAYLTGNFQGSASFGATTLTSQGGYDGFVVGVSPAGSWQGAQRFGGSGNDYATGVVPDGRGNAFVVGGCQAEAAFGATTLPSVGGEYGVVAKYGPAGWQWAVRPTGTGHGAQFTGLDGAGRLYVVGGVRGPAAFGSTTLTPTATEKAYWAELDTTTHQWRRAQLLPSPTGNFDNTALTVRPDGVLHLAGMFSNTISLGSTTYSAPGRGDLYAGKLTLPSTVQAPAPALGAAGTRVVLRGTRLEAVSQVTLAGLPASFTVDSPEQLTVTVPPAAPLGSAPFTLLTPDGPLASAAFTVTAATAASSAQGPRPALQAYPNPARQHLRVISPQGRPVLLDALGRVCAVPTVATHPDGVTLAVAGLPAGLYVLRAGAHYCRIRIE